MEPDARFAQPGPSMNPLAAWCVRHRDAIIRHAQRTPYSHLPDYMNRWWIIRPRWWTLRWGLRVHQILASDTGRDMHDHPGASISILLRGRYIEAMPADPDQHPTWDWSKDGGCIWREVGEGQMVVRSRRAAHSLTLPDGPAWTLFAMRVSQAWGFRTKRGWVWWREYLDDWDGVQPQEWKRLAKRRRRERFVAVSPADRGAQEVRSGRE
jgi:hypothetical protein